MAGNVPKNVFPLVHEQRTPPFLLRYPGFGKVGRMPGNVQARNSFSPCFVLEKL